jgi:hypothetical protein
VAADGADRVGSSRRSHYRYRAQRTPPPHHASPRLPTGGGGCRTRNPGHFSHPHCSSHYLPGARSCLLRSTPGRALRPPLCSYSRAPRSQGHYRALGTGRLTVPSFSRQQVAGSIPAGRQPCAIRRRRLKSCWVHAEVAGVGSQEIEPSSRLPLTEDSRRQLPPPPSFTSTATFSPAFTSMLANARSAPLRATSWYRPAFNVSIGASS